MTQRGNDGRKLKSRTKSASLTTHTSTTNRLIGVKTTKTFQSLSYFCRFIGEAIKLKHDQEYDLLIVDYDSLMENTEAEDETGWNCSVHPSVFFLLGTLLLTTCATGMLCGAIMTDHWEEWLLDKTVAKVCTDDIRERTIAFLVPMHGGIWTLCVSLTGEEISLLQQVGFPPVQPCVNYLSGGIEGARGYEHSRTDWQHRMQNLSISCALVCLIVLGSAALVGAFGVFQPQISAVLVTGVMYLLAASFALFTLTIIHSKRLHSKLNETDSAVDGVVSPTGSRGVKELLAARVFTTSWSLDLGWGGVMLCVMTSVLWILLSKIMRFNPLSSMIHY
ncbi:hypothetical protein NQ317_017596 [Molorchus minor]|uniref:Uncharacterized protein n=1 Tax=Molorchus minor TaxID=1323400 RepID=A0ABQ9IZZ9_9CUCU|nr:hypothetical protein NQ317_017596 [Molorchus minor]